MSFRLRSGWHLFQMPPRLPTPPDPHSLLPHLLLADELTLRSQTLLGALSLVCRLSSVCPSPGSSVPSGAQGAVSRVPEAGG